MRAYSDFMCDCSDEGKRACAELMERVFKELEATPGDLLSKVVYGLQWGLPYQEGKENYVGNVESIGCDMWCGISVSVQRFDYAKDHYVDHASIYVRCDRVEHGIARVWELAVEAASPEGVDSE